MTTITPARRAPQAVRSVGYSIAASLQLVFLWMINIWPGWAAVPFLTDRAGPIVALVNASLVLTFVANVAYLVYDPPWLRNLGELATTAIGLVVLGRLWQVFPFAFTDPSVNWAHIVRIALGFVIGASILGLVVRSVVAIRSAATGARTPDGE